MKIDIDELKFKTAWYTFMARMNDNYLETPEQTLALVIAGDAILQNVKSLENKGEYNGQ